MLDKLQALEQTLTQISNKYHVIATELANLQNRTTSDAHNEERITQLTLQLSKTQERLEHLQAQLGTQSEQLKEKTLQVETLNQKNAQLVQENNELRQKNQLAVQRAELIQTWLTNIDNAQVSQTNPQSSA